MIKVMKRLPGILLFFLIPCLIYAQTGKIRGILTDIDTNELLIGANVTIEGTGLGTSSDITGTYIILAVPPGVYTIRVTYIGYHAEIIQNVRVNAGLTTTQDIEMAIEVISGEELFVIAERPLIQRNTTNTIRMTTEEDIQNIPVRGLQNIISMHAGTILQNGTLHIRGGREGEIAYFVDGITGTNPLYNAENINVIQEAVELSAVDHSGEDVLEPGIQRAFKRHLRPSQADSGGGEGGV